ncbi:MAG: DUF4377 domain-containing protein [Chitinophagales bacterium]
MNLLPIVFVFLIACSSANVSDTSSSQEPAKENTTAMPESDVPSTKANTTTLWISHYQVPCVGEGDVSLCYLAQEGPSIVEDNWEYFYDVIQGFDDYELGNVYQLKVNKTERKSPIPEDAGGFEYSLVEITAKEKADANTTFTLPLRMEPSALPFIMKKPEGDDYYLLDYTKVNLADKTLKTDLEKAIKGNSTFAGIFEHTSDPNTILLKSLEVD